MILAMVCWFDGPGGSRGVYTTRRARAERPTEGAKDIRARQRIPTSGVESVVVLAATVTPRMWMWMPDRGGAEPEPKPEEIAPVRSSARGGDE